MSTVPNFKFDLEQATGWSGPGGSAVQHTVNEFPVSTSFAAVSMRLEPGALRELHWHAVAAEWAYIVSGHCRVTVVSPSGDAEISDFGPGDVWYFPQRTRALDPRARPGRVSLPARLRRWALLRIRHVQHHRLGFANARRRAGTKPLTFGGRDRTASERGGLHRSGRRPARDAAADAQPSSKPEPAQP